MTLGILLVHSNVHGQVNANLPGYSGFIHYLLCTDEREPVAVNQMALIGPVNNNHVCAVAASKSAILTRGLTPPSDADLEVDEGTSSAGTSIAGVQVGLSRGGLPGSTVERAAPGRMWMMNPANGSLIPPDASQQYLDAAVLDWPDGCFVRVPPPQEDDMFSPDDRNRLDAKASFLEVPAGKAKWFSGADGATYVNLCAQGPSAAGGDAVCEVLVLCHDVATGAVTHSRAFTCPGNVPGVRGPIAQYFAVADITGDPGAVTLCLWNQGPGQLIAAVH